MGNKKTKNNKTITAIVLSIILLPLVIESLILTFLCPEGRIWLTFYFYLPVDSRLIVWNKQQRVINFDSTAAFKRVLPASLS